MVVASHPLFDLPGWVFDTGIDLISVVKSPRGSIRTAEFLDACDQGVVIIGGAVAGHPATVPCIWLNYDNWTGLVLLGTHLGLLIAWGPRNTWLPAMPHTCRVACWRPRRGAA